MEPALRFRIALLVWVGVALLACGSRTELDFFNPYGSADAAARGDDADANGSPPDDASCTRCADSGIAPMDASVGDAAITDASVDSPETFVPFSACLGDGSTLVVVDNVDTYFDTNIHQFAWSASHPSPSYLNVVLDDSPLYDQWYLVFTTSVERVGSGRALGPARGPRGPLP